MKIKWLKDCELEFITRYDDDTPTFETQSVKAGEIDDVDPLSYTRGIAAFQYGNGDCVYGIDRFSFEIVEGEDELDAVED